MEKLVMMFVVLFSFFALAEGEEGSVHSLTLEPQVVTPQFGKSSTSYTSFDFVTAEEVFYGPNFVEVEIREGYQTTSLYISLASKVSTKVKVVLSNPELVTSYEDLNEYLLYEGAQQTVNFTAFGPHEGTITILNELDEVLAVIPYRVKLENPFRHTISGNVSTSGSAGVSYSLSSQQGWSMSTSISLDKEGSFSGSISGSYSW